jgi:hypothetical protein
MSGVRTPSMGNQVRMHTAVRKVHQVKPWCARGKGEISDADKIPVTDAVAVLLQRSERTPQQTGIYLAADTFYPPLSMPGPGGPGCKGGKRKIDKKTTRNVQDY